MKTNLDRFKGIHPGSAIAVLGSSPTINLYKGEEDIAIAVNGSVMCNLQSVPNYFLCGDKDSYKRSWFERSLDYSLREGTFRIVSSFVAPYDHLVLPDPEERSGLQKILMEDEKHNTQWDCNIRFTPDFKLIGEGHGIWIYADIWEEEIRPHQKRLCRGGTASGIASQLAMIMGAEEIHLYGCTFGQTKSGHYGYDNKTEFGAIQDNQRIAMDYILSRIRAHGVRIISHGFTKLNVPKKIDFELEKPKEEKQPNNGQNEIILTGEIPQF